MGAERAGGGGGGGGGGLTKFGVYLGEHTAIGTSHNIQGLRGGAS